jgi:hypothetical protein
MVKIAANMAHISDQNKYQIAAQSIRLQRGQRDFIAIGLSVAPKYMTHIEQEFKSQDINIKTSIDGKIKDNKLDKAEFSLDFTKDFVNQDVQIFVNIGADLVTFKSPAGEKDFTAYVGATKNF